MMQMLEAVEANSALVDERCASRLHDMTAPVAHAEGRRGRAGSMPS